ncbi:MAG: hypothetical protein KH354_05270 [Clostridiales bacterium]|nr:hypothetical protein [Clostridiales bacterium]
MTWAEIAELFDRIEEQLIESLKRNLAPHRAWEKDEGFDWPAWQAEKLKNVWKYRNQNKKLIRQYAPVIDRETAKLLRDQFSEGKDDFFGVNTARLDKLIDEIQHTEQRAERAALRMMDDVYRRTIYQASTAMATGSVTLPKAIDMATKDFLAAGIRCIEYRDGRRVDIADYAHMALRTAAARSAMMGDAARRERIGIDTVLVSQYGACSETCLPWQGQVYIDDVFGTWNGERVGNRGKSRNGLWYPLLSDAIEGGLFHPNCRHTLTDWIEGVSRLPELMSGARIRQNAELEQKQRALERKVRKYKRLEIGSVEPETAKRYAEKRKAAQSELREFVDEHSDVLRRDYWREKVYTAESPTAQGLAASGEIEKETHKPPILLEKLERVEYNTAVEKLKQYEPEIADLNVENAIVVTQDGEVWRCFGTEQMVYPNEDLGEKLRGAYVTHNHPYERTEYSFSKADFELFDGFGLKVLRGVDDRYEYQLSRKELEVDTEPSIYEIQNADDLMKHHAAIRQAISKQVGYGRKKR